MSDPMTLLLPDVTRYLHETAIPVPAVTKRMTVTPLAQGEYHMNYRVTAESDLVFRVNVASQLHIDDQISYEFKTLSLLTPSGRTPRPLFVDNTKSQIPHGVGLMEYLPGEVLDYRTDCAEAARLFAKIHSIRPDEEAIQQAMAALIQAGHHPESEISTDLHLIREEAPLSLIFHECDDLIETYVTSPMADPSIRSYLLEVRHWAGENREKGDQYYQADPMASILNTEVNATNFIANRKNRTLHLVDWEMARFGDPSQDLSHFCSPLTTMWKTPYRMTEREKQGWIATYAAHTPSPHLAATIGDRVRIRDPYVYLRGISWSAMAWVAYQSDDFNGVKNPSTWETLKRYMNLSLIRELFDPFLKKGDLL